MTVSSTRVLSGNVEVVPAVLARLGHGAGCVVLVSGAPGSGKSTTMNAVLQALSIHVPRVARVSADETSRRQPFGVASAMVGVRAEYPPLPDTADLVLAAVEELCAQGPAVLCVDDVHQADADSLRVFHQLVAVVRDLPLVVLLTRRWFPVREMLDVLATELDVVQVEVVGVDDDGLGAIVRDRCGAAPGPALREALQIAGGNPFHVQGLLADLQRHGHLQPLDGLTELTRPAEEPSVTLPSVQDSVRAQLIQLDGDATGLLEILAVWGRPAPLTVLSEIADLVPARIREMVGPAVDLEVVQWTPDGELRFVHDLYRDVLYDDLLPGLRRMLHAACAAELRVAGGRNTEIVQHVGDSLSDGVLVAEALRTATTDLQYAPEQAADLLSQVQTRPGSAEADAVAIARGGALAFAGRMEDALKVVRDALAVTRDTQAHNTLTRLLLHNLVHAARSDEAVAVIDDELRHTADPAYRDALVHLRRWVLVLSGDVHLHGGRPTADGDTGAALVPSAVEVFLQARCESALDLIERAEHHRRTSDAPGWSNGATSPTWAPWFALYARGPVVATELSVQARRDAQRTGRGWLFPQHLGVVGSIDQFAGRWDDAMTFYDAQWEFSTLAGSGWRSRGAGGRLQIQVLRGALDDAAVGIQQWYATGHPAQFGLPWVEFAELLLFEARGDAAAARRVAGRLWSQPLQSGRLLWALLVGPDLARISRWCGDDALLQRVRRDTSAVDLSEAKMLMPVPLLVDAMATADPAAAADAAQALGESGSALGEVYGWEEAAVAAATAGDRATARAHAGRCSRLAADLGATTVERRVAARLRDHGIRLGATGARGRPASGPASLTPTETLVAERVAQGLTSPQVAAELYISPRTVQTHVSNILRKLGLRSRVELAAMFARRPDEQP